MTELTRNQELVLKALTAQKAPMSAYDILDRLRDSGLRAPLQVYRALEKLMSLGHVHRLESLNAFVACDHPGCEVHQTVVFAICDACGGVSELSDRALAQQLVSITHSADFKLTKSTVELRGECVACQRAS